MFVRNRNKFLLALLATLLPHFLLGQVVRPAFSVPQKEIDRLAYVDLSNTLQASWSLRTNPLEEARAKRYSRHERVPIYDPNDPSHAGRQIQLTRYQHGTSNLSLRTRSADLIVYGHIASATARMSANLGSVYTVYSFIPKQVPLKGSIPLNIPISVEREGGAYLLPSGDKRIDGVIGQGLPEAGFDYLLLLHRENEGYRIISGYYMSDSHPKALDAIDDALTPDTTSSLLSLLRNNVANPQH